MRQREDDWWVDFCEVAQNERESYGGLWKMKCYVLNLHITNSDSSTLFDTGRAVPNKINIFIRYDIVVVLVSVITNRIGYSFFVVC